MMENIEQLVHKVKGDTRPVSIADQVATSSTESQSIRVRGDGIIEPKIQVRIYSGAELDLELEILKVSANGSSEVSLINFAGKSVIDGDDDFYEFPISTPVKENEEIMVRATNNSGSYAYDYRVNLGINYAMGG